MFIQFKLAWVEAKVFLGHLKITKEFYGLLTGHPRLTEHLILLAPSLQRGFSDLFNTLRAQILNVSRPWITFLARFLKLETQSKLFILVSLRSLQYLCALELLIISDEGRIKVGRKMITVVEDTLITYV